MIVQDKIPFRKGCFGNSLIGEYSKKL